jgi:succinate-semialdehyde dehydrogenase / glutarate-semialdehyde dehydrogenase
MPFSAINPTTGEPIASVPLSSAAEVDASLGRAAAAFPKWQRLPMHGRATVLGRIASIFEAEHERLGAIATREMGKPLGAAIAEVDKCALACRHFGENVDHMLADEELTDPGGVREIVRYEALGPILAIMPWNFPYWQLIRFAAPALAAGNVVLLKPASSVPGTAAALADVFRRAGVPEGVFEVLYLDPPEIAGVIADARVAAVTLTGSERAGRAVAAAAGTALKKSILELGGSDPFIVLPSADLERAVTIAVKARMVNNGQSCIAAKRFIVTAPIYETFRERFVAAVAALKVGDPMDPATQIGPLATAAIRDEVAGQVTRSVAAGAKLLNGGTPAAGPGFFFTPTVLEDVPAEAPAARDEVFGPVAALFRAADLDEALRIANASRFGLGATVFTSNPDEADAAAAAIESGMVFINDMVASDPRFPFGGRKSSGYGRELGSHGIRELTNVKRIRVANLP